MIIRCFRFYSKITSIMDIKTFIFLDLETTGLPKYEFGSTKITELSLIAVQANHLRLGVLPRVQNKLTLCFNPRKQIQTKAAEITGLDNESLESQEEFSADTVKILQIFLNLQCKPICFVAHNGNYFDYPILRTEINRVNCELPSDIMCVDSLCVFRMLYHEDIESATESEVPTELMDGFDQYLCSLMDEIDAKGVKNEHIGKIQIENETTPKRNNKYDVQEVASNSKIANSNDLSLYFNPKPRREKKNVVTKAKAKKKLFNK